MTKTFNQIFEAAQNTDNSFDVLAILSSAEVNASDTVYVEKSAPVSEFDAVALSSLSDILANSANTAARAWFAAQGVRF